jgi:hypothetical protein
MLVVLLAQLALGQAWVFAAMVDMHNGQDMQMHKMTTASEHNSNMHHNHGGMSKMPDADASTELDCCASSGCSTCASGHCTSTFIGLSPSKSLIDFTFQSSFSDVLTGCPQKRPSYLFKPPIA